MLSITPQEINSITPAWTNVVYYSGVNLIVKKIAAGIFAACALALVSAGAVFCATAITIPAGIALIASGLGLGLLAASTYADLREKEALHEIVHKYLK
jgi:hypothetical protein